MAIAAVCTHGRPHFVPWCTTGNQQRCGNVVVAM